MSLSKQLWGNHIWYFMHCLAEKIKSEYFLEEKNNIIDIIKKISNNLPCPECSDHANTLLKKYNFKNINDKNQLKKFLYEFHNSINIKLNKPVFNYELLDETYKNSNIFIALHNINIILNTKINAPKLMMGSMHRHSLSKYLVNYFIQNKIKYV